MNFLIVLVNFAIGGHFLEILSLTVLVQYFTQKASVFSFIIFEGRDLCIQLEHHPLHVFAFGLRLVSEQSQNFSILSCFLFSKSACARTAVVFHLDKPAHTMAHSI